MDREHRVLLGTMVYRNVHSHRRCCVVGHRFMAPVQGIRRARSEAGRRPPARLQQSSVTSRGGTWRCGHHKEGACGSAEEDRWSVAGEAEQRAGGVLFGSGCDRRSALRCDARPPICRSLSVLLVTRGTSCFNAVFQVSALERKPEKQGLFLLRIVITHSTDSGSAVSPVPLFIPNRVSDCR